MESLHKPSVEDLKQWAFNPASLAIEAEHGRTYEYAGNVHSIESYNSPSGYTLRFMTNPSVSSMDQVVWLCASVDCECIRNVRTKIASLRGGSEMRIQGTLFGSTLDGNVHLRVTDFSVDLKAA